MRTGQGDAKSAKTNSLVAPLRLAVDTGGTFTDLVVEDAAGHLSLFKSPTTPANPVDGVLDVLALAAQFFRLDRAAFLDCGELFVHGTTIATNAIIMGRQAKTVFLTTAGHPDILVFREAGRIGLPLFDHSIDFPQPFIPRHLTFEIPERITADGQVLKPLDETATASVIEAVAAIKPEAIAVCLLWSIANPQHELQLGKMLRTRLPDTFVSLSHQVNPSIREYRRSSATAIDASLRPLMWRYMSQLEERLREAGFAGRVLVVTSQGVMRAAAEVAESPVHAVKSGPAMAPVAGRYYAETDSHVSTAIVADTGGTTYDVALVRDGRIPETRETWIGRPYLGHMTGFPSVDIRSVGAGGGSIAYVDAGGLLHVGPESAGSEPGPACYGRGGLKPTVTDAALMLGFLDPDYFLGGRMRLNVDLARRAIHNDVGLPLGILEERAALAILRLLTETMASAIEDITVNQGIDPRGAVLVGGGGAAGFNSVAIARRLGCRAVLFPGTGAALSAAGGLLCALSNSFTEFSVTNSRQFDFHKIGSVLSRLKARAHAFAVQTGGKGEVLVDLTTEARYAQQIWEIRLPLDGEDLASLESLERVVSRFHVLHHELFAFADPNAIIEFLTWRADVHCDVRCKPLGRITSQIERVRAQAREIILPSGPQSVPILGFDDLSPGVPQHGPAIIETAFTTIVVDMDAPFQATTSGGVQVSLYSTMEDRRPSGSD